MTRRGSRPAPRGDEWAKPAPSERPTAPSARKASGAAGEPEEAARAAIAHEPRATPSGDKVKLTLTVSLSREQAERLTARAIRKDKNLEALVAEILEATSERCSRSLSDSSPPIARAAI